MINNEKDIKLYVDYLVSLYYKTGCKYYCSRPIINRLLTIFNLCCMKENIDCFLHPICMLDSYVGIPFL